MVRGECGSALVGTEEPHVWPSREAQKLALPLGLTPLTSSFVALQGYLSPSLCCTQRANLTKCYIQGLQPSLL